MSKAILNPVRSEHHRNIHIVLLILVGLATHGLLLINDVRAGDDWMYLKWMENSEWETFKSFHARYNNFPQALALWPLTYFQNVIAALHCASLIIIICQGIVVYRICLLTGYFASTESFLLAALGICFPAFMWHASAIYSVFYNLPVLAFYLAAYLTLLSETRSGARKYFLQSLSVTLFLYSFHTGSLLVFFYGTAIVHCYFLATTRSLNFKQAIIFYVGRRTYFLILPLAFRLAYQLHQPYISNEIGLDPAMLSSGFDLFLRTIGQQLKNVLAEEAFLSIGGCCLLALVIARFVARNLVVTIVGKIARTPQHAAITLCIGLALLVFGTFGYVATGKTPYLDATLGYSTRTLLLVQVPIAIILVSLLQFLSAYALSRFLIVPIVSGLIAGSVTIQNRDGLNWLYFGVLDQAFKLNLSEIPGAKDISYFIVVDKAYYMANTHHPVASLPFAIAQIFRGPTHVFGDLDYAFDLKQANMASKNIASLTGEYVMAGRSLVEEWRLVMPTEYRQGVLVVCPGPAFYSRSHLRLVALYQYYRFLRPDRLAGLLAPLLHLRLIQMVPVSTLIPSGPPDASGCGPT